jgi:hypothetical protein
VILSLLVALTLAAPAGRIPEALPAQLWVGAGDVEPGAVWLRYSGVPFFARYRYLVSGWVNNWQPTTASDGRFARRYMDDSAAAGLVPVLTWYRLLGLPGGGESATYAKVRDAAAMKIYFEEFRVLMQVAKAFGKPVIVHLEPDGYAHLQQQSNANPAAYAAVAATGLWELQNSPNSLRGWGEAFARLRGTAGAMNVVLGPHYSTWSTGTDLMRGTGVTADIDTHVGRTAAFLTALGLSAQDVLFVEQLDRDAQTRGIWWTTGDDAGTNTQSFNRDMAIFNAVNVLTQKRLIAWQLPWGGANQRNVWENGTPGSGYMSNHVPWWFGAGGDGHRRLAASAGVVGLLFGAGAPGQSTMRTSVQQDGGLWSRGEVSRYLAPTLPVAPVCTGGTDGGPGGLELTR